MAFVDDVIDLITAEVTHIGLSEDGETEYSGGSYEALVPSYAAASDGSADLEATLEFDGAANDGPITHLVLKRSSELWRFVRLAVWDEQEQEWVPAPVSFNSDGRLDLTSAAITAAVVVGD